MSNAVKVHTAGGMIEILVAGMRFLLRCLTLLPSEYPGQAGREHSSRALARSASKRHGVEAGAAPCPAARVIHITGSNDPSQRQGTQGRLRERLFRVSV